MHLETGHLRLLMVRCPELPFDKTHTHTPPTLQPHTHRPGAMFEQSIPVVQEPQPEER